MASKFTVPYAPSSVYRANNSIAELMLRAGAINAEGARRSGEIWGSTIANLGQQVGGAVAQYQQEKQAKRAEEAKRQAVAQVENTVSAAKPTDDIEAIVSTLPPEYRDMARQKYMVIQGTRSKLREARDAHLKSWSEGLLPFLTGDESDIQKAELALSDLENEGFTEQAKRLRNQFRENPGTVKAMAMQMAGVKPEAPKTRTIKTRLADGSEVEQIVEDRPGQTFRSAAEPPKPPTSFDAAILAADQRGDVAEAKRLLERKAQAEAAGRKPDDPSFQAKEVLGDDGKPVMANFNARTGRYTDAKTGAEIKNPRPVPSAAETQDSRKFKQAAPILSAVSELSEKINTLNGVYAKAAGEAAKQAAKINLDDNVAEYESLISGFTPLVARALGHTGVLTQQDVDSVKALFPRPGDSKSLRDRKVSRIKSIIGELEAGAVGTPSIDSGVQVTAPNGKTYSFKNKAEADAFKKRAGIP